jgi:hypothetical protein
MSKKVDSFKEEFARFLEQPSRDGLRNVLKEHHGEFRNLDFKEQWPDRSGLVKHILGFGNSGGGCLVIGVHENSNKAFEPRGLLTCKDKADVDNEIRRFLPQALMETIKVMDFSYEATEYSKLIGKSFQVLIVPDNPINLPFLALADTVDLKRTVIYIRRMASTAEATYEEVQDVINRRLATGHSTQPDLDLSRHLQELRALHSQLVLFQMQHLFMADSSRSLGPVRMGDTIYETESLESFLKRMIFAKQRRIELMLAGSS